MFQSSKKAFGKAPHLFGGHHKKDPEIEIWTKDFAAAKVAMNTLDREIKESQTSVNNFVKLSVELYSDFVGVLTCDSSVPATHKIPDNPNVFAPLQEIVGKVDSIAHNHAVKCDKYIKEIRSLVQSVEDLLKKADHKKMDCDKIVQREQIDYDDPKGAEIPEIQEYLMYHYHMLSLVPQVIKKLDQLIELLIQKQLNYQLEIFGLIKDAIHRVAKTTNTPEFKDNVAILQHWSSEIEPVVAQLAKTKTVGSFAVMPPPPNTWKRAQNVPQNVVSSIPSVQQTKNFASGVGGSFKYGFSYIYPTDVKFFNPHKGMFGQVSDNDLKVAAEGKQITEDTPPVATPTSPKPIGEHSATTYAAEPVPLPTATTTEQAVDDNSSAEPTAALAQPGARPVAPRDEAPQTATARAPEAAQQIQTASPVSQDSPVTTTAAAKVEHYEHSPATALPHEQVPPPVTDILPVTTNPASPVVHEASPGAILTQPAPTTTANATTSPSTAAPTAAPTATPTGIPRSTENADDELL